MELKGESLQALVLTAGLGIAAIGLAPSSASAALVAVESFESYSTVSGANTLGGNGGIGEGWTSAWSAASTGVGVTVVGVNGAVQPTLNYSSGAIDISGGSQAAQVSVSSGSNVTFDPLMSRKFSAQSETVYMSMLLKQTAGGGESSNTDYIQFGVTDPTVTPDIAQSAMFNTGGSTGTGSNRFAARLIGTGTSDVSAQQTATNINQGDTYFVVLRLNKSPLSSNYDQLRFYLNPTSLTESANTSIAPADKVLSATEMGAFIGRLARVDSGDTILLDEIRIGSDWNSVVTVPEPGLMSMAAAGALSILGRRRRIS